VAERVRHIRVEFVSGLELTLPAEDWLDQQLVREMMAAAGGAPDWPALPESEWVEFVFAMAERSPEVAE
jgi:hypothetical protein